jgi:hypothetical protein
MKKPKDKKPCKPVDPPVTPQDDSGGNGGGPPPDG